MGPSPGGVGGCNEADRALSRWRVYHGDVGLLRVVCCLGCVIALQGVIFSPRHRSEQDAADQYGPKNSGQIREPKTQRHEQNSAKIRTIDSTGAFRYRAMPVQKLSAQRWPGCGKIFAKA